MKRLKPVGTYNIELDGQSISYILKISYRARRMRLEIRPDSGLTVVVPKRYPKDRLPQFIKEKSRWILNKLREQANKPVRSVNKLKTIQYLGKTLGITRKFGDNQFIMLSIEGDRLLVNTNGADVKHMLEQWYRNRAKELIANKVEHFSKLFNSPCGRVTIRNNRTRWGSCSRAGNLSFNWKLIQAHESVVDYVIIHELCHLIEMNHSKAFWKLVAHRCPSWREDRAWLKEHEPELSGW